MDRCDRRTAQKSPTTFPNATCSGKGTNTKFTSCTGTHTHQFSHNTRGRCDARERPPSTPLPCAPTPMAKRNNAVAGGA